MRWAATCACGTRWRRSWRRDYTVLRYDHRGHGKSEVVPGPYGIEDMADDAAALIEKQASGAVHFIGLSMGGMVAQQLAVRHPQLVTSIVVANSSSYYDEGARAMWKARIETVRSQGMEAIADGVMQRWFTPEFREDPEGAKRVAASRAVLVANIRRPTSTAARLCLASSFMAPIRALHVRHW